MTILYNILKLRGRRNELRSEQTPHEILLWSRLRRKQIGFKFRRQHSIGGYIVDFYCPAKRLVVELDGPQHFRKESKEYDQIRTEFFDGLDIRVLRFTNAEININIDGAVQKIVSFLEI